VFCCPCGVGQAICSESGLDIAFISGLEGDRVTYRHGTVRLDGQVCPREVWLHVCMDLLWPTWLMSYIRLLIYPADVVFAQHRHWPSLFLRHASGVTIGDRDFPAAASRTWHSLPSEVTSSRTPPTFKSKLKTYLFSLCFPVV